MDSDNEAAIGKVQSEEEIVTLAKKPKKKIGFTISETFQDEVIRVLKDNHATFENKMTAVAVAQRYAALYQKSIKEGMQLRDKSIKWWKVLKEIPGVSIYTTKGKPLDDASSIKLYLKDEFPPDLETINTRILTILKDYTTGLNGMSAGMIINKYTKRYGSLVSMDLASHTTTKFSKYVSQLENVGKVYDGSQPTFSYISEELPAQPRFSPIEEDENAEIDAVFEQQSDFAVDYLEHEGSSLRPVLDEEPQFSPPSSPSSSAVERLNPEVGIFFGDLDDKSSLSSLHQMGVEERSIKIDNAVVTGLGDGVQIFSKESSAKAFGTDPSRGQRKKRFEKEALDILIAKFLNDKSNDETKLQLKSLVIENVEFLNDSNIIAIIGCADIPPDDNLKGTTTSLTFIDDLVNIGLLSRRMQSIEDPLSNEVAWEYFGSLKKFRADQHIILGGLTCRLKSSLRSRSRESPAPNTAVTLPDNVKPVDVTEQWLSVNTLAEAFVRIRAFPFNAELVGIIGTLARKISETMHMAPKPVLIPSDSSLSAKTAFSKSSTYTYKIQDISYFSISQYARIVHSFRSYDHCHEDIITALHFINEKTNLMKCMEKSDKIIVGASDLKMITKGVIKLMQDAARAATTREREGSDGVKNEDHSEDASCVGIQNKNKFEPLHNICQFVACKLLDLPRNAGVDEDLVVNILQSIKGHSIEDNRIRMLMSATAKYAHSITHHDMKDERIVETLLQFVAVTIGKYHQSYSEVDDFLLILSKMMTLSYDKFVKSKFVAPGAEYPDASKLDQMSKNILHRSRRYGFEASELRYSMRNLTASSSIARYFFDAIRPWLNFVFAGNGFDHNNVVRNALTVDQVTRSYLGLSKFRDEIITENLRSFFNISLQSKVSLSKCEVDHIYFKFDRVVSKVMQIPFDQLFQVDFIDPIQNYSSDFVSHADLPDEHLIVYGKILNPRMKYNFLKMIGKCCTRWQEDDEIFTFVIEQLFSALNIHFEVDVEEVKRARESRKRKRDSTDEDGTSSCGGSILNGHDGSAYPNNNVFQDFPFFNIWGLYCELIYNIGKNKSWRTPSAKKLLQLIFSKLKILWPYISDDLFTTISNNPPIEKRCVLFLKHLSMLMTGLQGVAIIDCTFIDIFQFIKKIFITVYGDVTAAVTKGSVVHALHSNNLIMKGLSRMTTLHEGTEVSTLTMVIHKQLNLFQVFQQRISKHDSGDTESKNAHKQKQDNLVINLLKCFQCESFMKLLIGPKVFYQLESHNLFSYFLKNFETNFDKPILELMHNQASFPYFHGISEIFRSISIFFLFIDFTNDEYQQDYSHSQHTNNNQVDQHPSSKNISKKHNPFDIGVITSIISLFCEKIYFAICSFQNRGLLAQKILNLLSSQPIRSMADYNRILSALKDICPEVHRHGDTINNNNLGNPWTEDPEKSFHQQNGEFIEYGESAVNTLYNMRYFVHWFIQIHQSPWCCSIVQSCGDYLNFITDFHQMVGIQIWLAIIDFDGLSIKSIVKLLRFCMSFLEFHSSLSGFSNAQSMTFPRMELISLVLENLIRRSAKLLQGMFVSFTQHIPAVGSSKIATSNVVQDGSLATLLSKDTLELFQECFYFIQFYFCIFPYSCPLLTEPCEDGFVVNSQVKEFFKIEIESLKLIFDNIYDAVYQIPDNGLFHTRVRSDSFVPKSRDWQRVLEAECIQITKHLLSDTNQHAWNSVIPYAIVSSFASLLRLEYSSSTIVSFGNMYIHASSYHKVENGMNCVTIYHEFFGRVLIFSDELQLMPLDSLKFHNNWKKSKEDNQHHLLIDLIQECDFTSDGIFNLICDSAKTAKGFNIICALIVLNIDDSTSCVEDGDTEIHKKALEELVRMLLQYVGLMF